MLSGKSAAALILPVLLYCTLQEDGKIPNRAAEMPSKPTELAQLETMQKNYHKHRRKDTVLLYSQGSATLQDIEDCKIPVSMDRNLARHYECTLRICAALRIWSSHSTTPQEAERAQDHYTLACQTWAQMHTLLTPYFHYLVHGLPQILRQGPQPSYWLFGSERANGKLAKLCTNGHLGGELEGTLMRG